MFYTLGPASCIRNVCLTTSVADRSPKEHDVVRAYRAFCNVVAGDIVCPIEVRDRWVVDPSVIAHIVAHYKIDSAITDLSAEFLETPHSSRAAAQVVVEDALTELRNLDSQLGAVFDLYIHTMFYERSDHSGGGSVSSAPGVIWCSPRKNWSRRDVVEFLVHELTHNMLFIDERMNKYFPDMAVLSDPSNFALSTVLKKKRPLDKVFHSLVVGNEIVRFRQAHGEQQISRVHPSTGEIERAISATIESLQFAFEKHLVSERIVAIVDTIAKEQRLREQAQTAA